MPPDALTAAWTRNAADRNAVKRGCWFDLEAAEAVRDFLRTFVQPSKGDRADRPVELDEWQWLHIFAPLFGWKRADGSRRFRRAYIELPKKQSKSFCASSIGVYMLDGDGEKGAEVYSVATTRDQAGIVHNEAIAMVRASPGLCDDLKINGTTGTISCRRTNSSWRALSGEMEKKAAEGLNAHCLIMDELHVWNGREFWDALLYAGAARRQPLLLAISTAGDDMHSVCREQHDYALAVNAGEVDDPYFFGYIRCAEETDDLDDPATWHKANPALGKIISVDDFKAELEAAKRSPSALASFKRYRLNIWAVSTNPWLKAEHWAACGEDYTEADLLGLPCWAGLDLSRTYDMTALTLAFHWGEDEFRILPYFWLPDARVTERGAPMQYRAWKEAGLLKTMPGEGVDFAFVERDILEILARFEFRGLYYDPFQAKDMTARIETATGVERVSVTQRIGILGEPTGIFENAVINGKLRHNRNPILNWQAGHVQVESDTKGNKMVAKPPHNDNRKIDGIAAAVMALIGPKGAPRGAKTQYVSYV